MEIEGIVTKAKFERGEWPALTLTIEVLGQGIDFDDERDYMNAWNLAKKVPTGLEIRLVVPD